MGLDLKLLFTKSQRRTREEAAARITEVHHRFNGVGTPGHLAGQRRQAVLGFWYGRGADAGVPARFRRNDFDRKYHGHETEKRKSSKVKRTGFFALPIKETGLKPFELFAKTKARRPVMQIWEFLCLDLWSTMLRRYSATSSLTVSAPMPFCFEDDTLNMSFQFGTIGKHLAEDYKKTRRVPISGESVRVYPAFLRHLGALAAIKEGEELTHGDYQLRHVLFDAGGRIDPFFCFIRLLYEKKDPRSELYDAVTARHSQDKIYGFSQDYDYGLDPNAEYAPMDPFLSSPALSVVDIEHGLRATRRQAQEEDEQMLLQARKYVTSHGVSVEDFEREYRTGYDSVRPLNVIQAVVDEQKARLGISVDELY